MEQRNSSTASTEKAKKLSSAKTQEIQKLLSKKKEPKGTLTHGALATALFSKAPTDFLDAHEPKRLADVTVACMDALNAQCSDAKTVAVNGVEASPARSAIVIALNDRPFIVNTVTETLAARGLRAEIFLHPILLHEGKRSSVSYIEIPQLTESELATLCATIKGNLEHLIATTDDHSEIVAQIDGLSKHVENPFYAIPSTREHRKEISDFIRFLTDGGFIFLAHAKWTLNGNGQVNSKPYSTLGLLRVKSPITQDMSKDIEADANRLLASKGVIEISRLRAESPVHRRIRPTVLAIPEFSREGKPVAVHTVVGILTSKALAEESSSIPLIRTKLRQIIDRSDVVPNSHDHKQIINIVDSMPKDELLRRDTDSLFDDIQGVRAIQKNNETHVSVHNDASGRSVSVLVVMPQTRFTHEVLKALEAHLSTAFNSAPGSIEHHVALSGADLARIHFSIVLPAKAPTVNVADLEEKLSELTKNWEDQLIARLKASQYFDDVDLVARRYQSAFPETYQTKFSPEDAERDIGILETLTPEKPTNFRLIRQQDAEAGANTFTIASYSLGSQFDLSRAVPILENAGLFVVREDAVRVSFRHATTKAESGETVAYIDHFVVRSTQSAAITEELFEKYFKPGLLSLFSGTAENDVLNSLLVSGPLDVRAISVLRAYSALLWQVSKFATRRTNLDSLAGNPEFAVRLWKLFQAKFDPSIKGSMQKRREQVATLLAEYREALRSVKNITADKVLRNLALLLEYTVRTNAFRDAPALAFKLHSEKIEILPNPKPKYEIFVHSAEVEGVHLRTDMVARGGLRWSERPEDYRTEVLGLVKTQKIKNALIVPSGAKGGFILRKPAASPDKVGEAVTAAYKTFIRSLLSVTDNRVNDTVKHPDNVVVFDGEDPYFVVAADKGTANFSDIANEIAVKEFDFWLGDGFASGGSRGYSHKAYAVTAKGVWECTKRHFNDIGLDHEKTPFTVVGIGDMSGDVFGNGLILSPRMKLVAAFDHRHIFLDPNPDPAKSFAERKRLFDLPRSSWADYSKSLISKGGGVFARTEKEIEVTPEVRAALSIPADAPEVMDSETLMTHILKAEVDLLWNGGIGTYVKAKSETNSDVGDSSNDNIRVNGSELRARVIGEGGNLGFTQKGRIEFERTSKGFRKINTDAIDNSGGVDLSDHEVNLKILFTGLIKAKKLTFEDRDKLLKEIATPVNEDVLSHNASQALVLTLAASRSAQNIEYYRYLMRETSRLGYISRLLESLPHEAELDERASRSEGLARPELAVCISATKMWAKDILVQSRIVEEEVLKPYLHRYFPDKVEKKFSKDIDSHPIADNIIATQVVNDLLDATGLTFLPRIMHTLSASPAKTLRCGLAAELILGTRELRAELLTHDTVANNKAFLESYAEIHDVMYRTAGWLAQYHEEDATIEEMVEAYQESYQALVKEPEILLDSTERAAYQARVTSLTAAKISKQTAQRIAIFPSIIRVLEVLWTEKVTSKKLPVVAATYSQLTQALGVGEILKLEGFFEGLNKWENELIADSFGSIRRGLSTLTGRVVGASGKGEKALMDKIQANPSLARARGVLEEIKGRSPSAAELAVVAKHIRALTEV